MERYNKTIAGYDVLFVRIGGIVGYFVNIDGKEIGNSAGVFNKRSIDFDDNHNQEEIRKEIDDLFEMLEENARDTILKQKNESPFYK